MESLTILGSAAAEGIPARFCDCPVCRKAWENKGKDFRTTTAYAFNERVRIDYGPDSYAQELRFGLRSARMKHLFFTHEHEDHLDLFALSMRGPGFSHGFALPLNIYARPTVWNRFRAEFGKTHPVFETLKFHLLRPFEPVELPEEEDDFIIGDRLGEVESVNSSSDIYSPISGTVSQVNEALADEPGLINESPEEKGWLCRLVNFDSSELDDMMNEDAYRKYLRKLNR